MSNLSSASSSSSSELEVVPLSLVLVVPSSLLVVVLLVVLDACKSSVPELVELVVLPSESESELVVVPSPVVESVSVPVDAVRILLFR